MRQRMSILRAVFLLVSAVALGGCTHFQEQLRHVQLSTRTDVFQEVPADMPIPSGYADVSLVVSLKTHEPGRYLLEKSSHGTPEYQLVLNIDGQALQMKGSLHEENLIRRFGEPEGGRGIRYTFSKNLRLRAGSHTVALALPADSVIGKYHITLPDRSRNTLEVHPVYGTLPGKQRPGFYGLTSFLQGITELKGSLNGRPM